jgi:hypothetical protein
MHACKCFQETDYCRNCDGQNESMLECEKESPQNGVTVASLKEKAKLLRCGSLSWLNWWIQYIIYLVLLYTVVDWCDVHDSIYNDFMFMIILHYFMFMIVCSWFYVTLFPAAVEKTRLEYVHDFMSHYFLPQLHPCACSHHQWDLSIYSLPCSYHHEAPWQTLRSQTPLTPSCIGAVLVHCPYLS